MTGWIIASIFGLFIIIFQLLMPDLVTGAVLDILSDNTTSHFIGLRPALQAFLILWIIGGYVLFIGGIVGTFISYRSRNSK